MKTLVLGGTRFVGRAIVETLLANGHDVTLFNRGSDTTSFPKAERILGDRNNIDDLGQAARCDWEAIVDVNGYHPEQIRKVLPSLANNANHYLFISTISVYDHPHAGAAEDGPKLEVDENIDTNDPLAYGGLKVLCEKELLKSIETLTILRPTIVIGPHDYTDRFSWWVRKIATGRVISPSRLDQPLQLIDAADLADFTVRCIDNRINGTFNVVGPRNPITLGEMVKILSDAFGVNVAMIPTDDVSAIPLTLRPDGSEDGIFSLDGSSAYAVGLSLSPVAESAQAVREAVSS